MAAGRRPGGDCLRLFAAGPSGEHPVPMLFPMLFTTIGCDG